MGSIGTLSRISGGRLVAYLSIWVTGLVLVLSGCVITELVLQKPDSVVFVSSVGGFWLSQLGAKLWPFVRGSEQGASARKAMVLAATFFAVAIVVYLLSWLASNLLGLSFAGALMGSAAIIVATWFARTSLRSETEE